MSFKDEVFKIISFNSNGVVDIIKNESNLPKNNISYDDYWTAKNNSIQALLRDFPWLWAIKPYWSCHDSGLVQVSQDLLNLRALLSRDSGETRYRIWILRVNCGDLFSREMLSVPRSMGVKWVEAILKKVSPNHSMMYIFVEDPIWGEDHPTRHVTIYRHSDKIFFDEFIEELSRIFASKK